MSQPWAGPPPSLPDLRQPAATPAIGAPPADPPSGPALEVTEVSRSFGRVHAVSHMNLTAQRGRVTALVGPNGCGKSTLMLMLATLLAPDEGTVRVCGIDVTRDPAAVRARVGWMPDQFGTWDSLRVREVLGVVGGAYFMDRADVALRIPELLARLDLETLADQPAHVLSRGQKQRLGLARALMHRPEVLILDEPASGLDPASRLNLQRIVREFAGDGGSVLISSHILTELEEMADDVVLMDHGRLVAQSSLADLARRPRPWRIESLDAESLRGALDAVGLRSVEVEDPRTTVSGHAQATALVGDETQAARLLGDLTAADARIVAFSPAAGRLESFYLTTDAAQRKGAL